jgi:hypothetical protein
VHGELDASYVLWDEAEDTLCLVGLRQAGEPGEELQNGDLRALGQLVAMAGVASEDETLEQLLRELEASPSRTATEKIIARLRDS